MDTNVIGKKMCTIGKIKINPFCICCSREAAPEHRAPIVCTFGLGNVGNVGKNLGKNANPQNDIFADVCLCTLVCADVYFEMKLYG
jgi:hypothetical protein